MSGRQWIGLAVVVLAIGGSLLVPAVRPGDGPDGPDHGCADARSLPDDDASAARAATLCLLNAERDAQGRGALRENAALRRAAVAHARDMAERDFFAHESPSGTTPTQRIRAAGYGRPTTGENLAFGDGDAGAPSAIVDGWMHSPGHRANILLRRFDEIGIGIVEDGERALYVTTFGGRR